MISLGEEKGDKRDIVLFPPNCIIQLLVNSRKTSIETKLREIRNAAMRLTFSFLVETFNTLHLSKEAFEG